MYAPNIAGKYYAIVGQNCHGKALFVGLTLESLILSLIAIIDRKCGTSSTAEASYIYYKTSSMATFTLLQKLTSGYNGLIGFGTSVSINYNRVIVGAPYYSGGPFYGNSHSCSTK